MRNYIHVVIKLIGKNFKSIKNFITHKRIQINCLRKVIQVRKTHKFFFEIWLNIMSVCRIYKNNLKEIFSKVLKVSFINLLIKAKDSLDL